MADQTVQQILSLDELFHQKGSGTDIKTSIQQLKDCIYQHEVSREAFIKTTEKDFTIVAMFIFNEHCHCTSPSIESCTICIANFKEIYVFIGNELLSDTKVSVDDACSLLEAFKGSLQTTSTKPKCLLDKARNIVLEATRRIIYCYFGMVR